MAETGALWLQLAVPVLLVVIMVSMGLELTLGDFRRVFELPKPALIGLAGQLLLLPLLGIALAWSGGLTPELAVGAVVITACPGGAPSNVFTYLARANVALSVTLTALSSMLTIFTIPFWVDLGLELFLGESRALRLPLARTSLQLFGLSLLPVALGMGLRAWRPERARRLRPRLRRAMLILFVLATLLIVTSQWTVLVRDFPVAVPSALALVLLALGLSFLLARLLRVGRRDAFTISIEVGLQNGALATVIVVNLLGRPELVIFPGAYALLAFLPVGLFAIGYRALEGSSRAGPPSAGGGPGSQSSPPSGAGRARWL